MTPILQPILATTPGNGPFSQTEVSIYCDESRHEGQRAQQYMVIGGLWLPRANRRVILEGLRQIQRQHKVSGEVKWRKVSPSALPGYSALVDFVASRHDVHFRCIVVDKSMVNHDKYFHNDRRFGFWAFYLHCLKEWMGNQNTYYISIDFKPESLHSGPNRLRKSLETECVGRCWLKSLHCVDSSENLFCQIADLFIGAVGYDQNRLSGAPARSALAAHIARLYGRPDLRGDDRPSTHHFNVFRNRP